MTISIYEARFFNLGKNVEDYRQQLKLRFLCFKDFMCLSFPDHAINFKFRKQSFLRFQGWILGRLNTSMTFLLTSADSLSFTASRRALFFGGVNIEAEALMEKLKGLLNRSCDKLGFRVSLTNVPDTLGIMLLLFLPFSCVLTNKSLSVLNNTFLCWVHCKKILSIWFLFFFSTYLQCIYLIFSSQQYGISYPSTYWHCNIHHLTVRITDAQTYLRYKVSATMKNWEFLNLTC